MSKRNKNSSKKQKRSKSYSTKTSTTAPTATRRSFLQTARNASIAFAIVGGGSYFMVQKVQASLAEEDLTKISADRPTIVQIHDPNCSLCRSLQKQTRKAMNTMGDDAPDYFVANISTEAGRVFAAQYNAAHVTLLLFGQDGKLVERVEGTKTRNQLVPIFERLVAPF